MNNELQKQILLHTFRQLGIFDSELKLSVIESMIDNKFLVNKKMSFESIDKIRYDNNIYAADGKIAKHNIKILVADIKEDIAEFAVIFQMDKFHPFALRLSADESDVGSIYFYNDNRWIAADTGMQASFLHGIEILAGTLLEWNKMKSYDEMYKLAIQFLNYYASLDE